MTEEGYGFRVVGGGKGLKVGGVVKTGDVRFLLT